MCIICLLTYVPCAYRLYGHGLLMSSIKMMGVSIIMLLRLSNSKKQRYSYLVRLRWNTPPPPPPRLTPPPLLQFALSGHPPNSLTKRTKMPTNKPVVVEDEQLHPGKLPQLGRDVSCAVIIVLKIKKRAQRVITPEPESTMAVRPNDLNAPPRLELNRSPLP